MRYTVVTHLDSLMHYLQAVVEIPTSWYADMLSHEPGKGHAHH
jgi:hypothetical protein